MIIEKLLDEKNLTESEKQIAHYLLEKSHYINQLTCEELGKVSFTSQSSVSRLCKKLGFITFREFLTSLMIERNEYFKTLNFTTPLTSHLYSSYEDTQTTISSLYFETMVNTNLLLDKNKVIRICNRIMSASSIHVYGIGSSNTIAQQMAFHLQSLGLNCSYQNGFNIDYIDKLDIKNNVSILISLTPFNKSMIRIAEILSNHHTYTVSITSKDDNSLVDICNDSLVFSTNKDHEVNPIDKVFASEYIIDLIYALILSRNVS
ncbi:MurR/RpiR family transcriptional regulator [Longibaculum muris]|uniref:MurR/RpiR family transcriptional regulator n=1 Tax=Longibaculum muris TaxID=1796628 RepID=UPI0012B905E7|nr:MurR/RpiR family transcriptional regulator [Longibaculum muris]